MRTVSAVVLAGACLALPSTASAQSSPLCPLGGGGPYEYQAALLPLIGGSAAPAGGGMEVARTTLGAQYGGLFFDRDGTGSAAAVQFATASTGLALTNSDFVVV